MSVFIELFYSPICPHCPKAKETLLEVLEKVNHEIHVDEVNVFSREGLERAKKYGVMSVPTIVLNMERKIIGVPSKERLFAAINHEIMKNK